ncbi:MAG: TIGR03546 family protein [Thermodesulfobacteriota bacterium]|nr:TIGR03546 family protein [Thermodesulfobacteriota bacterium]
MLKMIAKLLKLLNSETDPYQISLAFGFSMIAGLTPLLSLHNLLLLFLILFLRVNLSSFIVGLIFFSGVAYLLDPFFNWFGLLILTMSSLEGFFTMLYNSTLWRFEGFNNSIVMGSLIFSLLFFVPLFLLTNMLIRKYREHIMVWIQKSRVMQAIKATKLYGFYHAIIG